MATTTASLNLLTGVYFSSVVTVKKMQRVCNKTKEVKSMEVVLFEQTLRL